MIPSLPVFRTFVGRQEAIRFFPAASHVEIKRMLQSEDKALKRSVVPCPG